MIFAKITPRSTAQHITKKEFSFLVVLNRLTYIFRNMWNVHKRSWKQTKQVQRDIGPTMEIARGLTIQ